MKSFIWDLRSTWDVQWKNNKRKWKSWNLETFLIEFHNWCVIANFHMITISAWKTNFVSFVKSSSDESHIPYSIDVQLFNIRKRAFNYCRSNAYKEYNSEKTLSLIKSFTATHKLTNFSTIWLSPHHHVAPFLPHHYQEKIENNKLLIKQHDEWMKRMYARCEWSFKWLRICSIIIIVSGFFKHRSIVLLLVSLGKKTKFRIFIRWH